MAIGDVVSKHYDNGVSPGVRPVVLYFNGTFVYRANGAHARVISMIEFLIKCGCHLVVYSFSDHFDCPWGPEEVKLFRARFPQVDLVLDRRSTYFNLWKRAKKLLSSVIPAATKKLVRFRLPNTTPNYVRLNARLPNAVLIINYANGLIELNGVTSSATIIETHDLDFLQFKKKYNYSLTSSKIMGKLRSELALLETASMLIALAVPEATLFRLCFPDKPVLFVPALNTFPISDSPIDPTLMDNDIVFVASDHIFNIDGLCMFIQQYHEFLSEHTLTVAGNVCRSDRVQKAAQSLPNVRLLGFVDDILDLYSRSKVAISPVEGTGVKIKVIEALAAGKPVFASRHSIDGLPPGYQNCLFPLASICSSNLLDNPAALIEAGEAARSYAGNLAAAFDADRLKAHLREIGA
jgi:glycosyltransferase involved in cell wall biosynthesis